jgi:hypothetical protein
MEGEIFNQWGIKNVYDISIGRLNFLAEELSNIVLKEYIEDNQDGVSSLEET